MTTPSFQSIPDLDAYIAGRMDAAHLPGLGCGLVKDGVLIWAKGYGLADASAKRPVTPDTQFKLASISKLVTATAIVRAAEQGVIDLDADINRYLPFDVRHPNHPKKAITTRMLLSHTSSICDNETVLSRLYTTGEPPLRLIQVLWDYLCPNGRFYSASENYCEKGPGECFEFCTMAMSLAALIVERVSGQPFDGYCTRQVIEPLGMGGAFWKTSAHVERLAMPYRYRAMGGYEARGHYAIPNYPDSGLHASVAELAPLFRILAGEENPVLKADSARFMREVHFPEVAPNVGLGCYWEDREGTALLGHAGADDGVATRMFWYPVENLGIITLANGEPTMKGRWALMAIERALFDAAASLRTLNTSGDAESQGASSSVVPFPKRHAS